MMQNDMINPREYVKNSIKLEKIQESLQQLEKEITHLDNHIQFTVYTGSDSELGGLGFCLDDVKILAEQDAAGGLAEDADPGGEARAGPGARAAHPRARAGGDPGAAAGAGRHEKGPSGRLLI